MPAINKKKHTNKTQLYNSKQENKRKMLTISQQQNNIGAYPPIPIQSVSVIAHNGW